MGLKMTVPKTSHLLPSCGHFYINIKYANNFKKIIIIIPYFFVSFKIQAQKKKTQKIMDKKITVTNK